MSWRKRPIRAWELLAGIGVLALLALILVPAIGRARESSRRATCQNNLKQMGIVFKMYSIENKDTFPPISPIPDNWMVDTATVWPEYLTDLRVLICPDSPFGMPLTFTSDDTGTVDPRCVSGLFYIYTGYTIFSDEQALALFDAYHEVPFAQFAYGHHLELPVPTWEDSNRLHGNPGQSGIPVLWDRVPLYEEEFSHQPPGGNVLHMDGHVEYVRYSSYNNSNYFPITRLSAETFGSVMPRMPIYCR